jgi:hypothetical protein
LSWAPPGLLPVTTCDSEDARSIEADRPARKNKNRSSESLLASGQFTELRN